MECVHGFAYEWEYSTDDRNVINCIIPATGGKSRCYVSLDEKSMRLWDKTHEYSVNTWDRDNYIRVIVSIPSLRIFIAAALDMSFKVYDNNLLRIGQCDVKVDKEDIRAVLAMKYDKDNKEIITGGLSGCQRWRLDGDRFRGFQLVHLQTLELSAGKWIDYMCLASASKLIFCCHGCNVSVYQFEEFSSSDSHFDSNMLLTSSVTENKKSRQAVLVKILENIHEHKITGCLFQEENNYLITASLGFEIKVLSAASSYALVHTFVGHARAVTALLSHPKSGLIVSASMDCTLRVWNLDTLQEEYHLQTSEPIHGVATGWSKSTVLSMTPSRVVAWRLHHIVNVFTLCRSPVVGLEQSVANGFVVRSRDYSVRLVDDQGICKCTLLPDSAVSMMKKVLSAPGLLIGLLTNGRVFAYSTVSLTASMKYQMGADMNITDFAIGKLGSERMRELRGEGSDSEPVSEYCLLCATSKGNVLVFNVGTGEQLGSESVHKDAISHIFSCHESTIVCIVPTEGVIILGSDMRPLRSISLLRTPFFDGRNLVPLSCIHAIEGDTNNDEMLLFLGLPSGVFDILDLQTGNLLFFGSKEESLCEHDGRVCTASFFRTSYGDLLFATGGDDGRIKVWMKGRHLSGYTKHLSPETALVVPVVELLCELPLTSRVKALAFLPSGDLLFGEGNHLSRVEKRDLWLGPYLNAVHNQKEITVLKPNDFNEREATGPELAVSRTTSEGIPEVLNNLASAKLQRENVDTNSDKNSSNLQGQVFDEGGPVELQIDIQGVEGVGTEDAQVSTSHQPNQSTVTVNAAVRPLLPRGKSSVFKIHKLRTTQFYKSKIEVLPAPVASPYIASSPQNEHSISTTSGQLSTAGQKHAKSSEIGELGLSSYNFKNVGRNRTTKKKRQRRKEKISSSGVKSSLPAAEFSLQSLEGQSINRNGVFLPAFVPFSSMPLPKQRRR